VRRKCYLLHYALDLFTLTARELRVTNIRASERLSNFMRLGEGDIVMGDRAYGSLPGTAGVRQQRADYVLRIKPRRFPVCSGSGRKIDLLKRFSRLRAGKTASVTGKCMVNGRYEPVRICAMRKDAGSEQAGLKRLARENQRKQGGKAVTDEQRESNKHVVVATSLGKEVSATRVLELYRLRWQIEIAFKRLKSLFHYNDLPSSNPRGVKAWSYGKLLLAALCETLVNTGRFSPSGKRRQ
jgi:hypothetical protein